MPIFRERWRRSGRTLHTAATAYALPCSIGRRAKADGAHRIRTETRPPSTYVRGRDGATRQTGCSLPRRSSRKRRRAESPTTGMESADLIACTTPSAATMSKRSPAIPPSASRPHSAARDRSRIADHPNGSAHTNRLAVAVSAIQYTHGDSAVDGPQDVQEVDNDDWVCRRGED